MRKKSKKNDRERAVIYARVSSEEQKKTGYSLEYQIEKLKEYCKAQGYEVVAVIEEQASGKSINRVGLQQALDLLHSGKASRLVFWRIDRLTRNVADSAGILKLSDKENWDLVAVCEQIDTKSAMGRFLFTQIVNAAQLERERLAERVKEGIEQAKKSGGKTGGKAQYGYKFVKRAGKKMAVEVPEEQAIIKKARKLRKLGLSYKAIANELNSRCLWTRKGTAWTATQADRLVNNKDRAVKVSA